MVGSGNMAAIMGRTVAMTVAGMVWLDMPAVAVSNAG
jgi:hypothetical protein